METMYYVGKSVVGGREVTGQLIKTRVIYTSKDSEELYIIYPTNQSYYVECMQNEIGDLYNNCMGDGVIVSKESIEEVGPNTVVDREYLEEANETLSDYNL